MMYKLSPNGDSVMLGGMSIPFDEGNRHYREYLEWLALGNVPDPADEQTPAQIARSAEATGATDIARSWFAANQTAVKNFIRLSPAEQEAAIDGYTLAQLKTVVKFMAIIVSALVKREFL